MTSRLFIWIFLLGSVAVFAIGTINIMRLRVEADIIGSRIQRIERDIAFSKRELDVVRRQRDQAIDTLQLQQRIGDSLKTPTPEQVVWIRISPPQVTVATPFTASPRMTAREIAFLSAGWQGGSSAR